MSLTSLQNPQVKALVRLREKKSERLETGSFLIEGRRELLRAIRCGFRIQTIYSCPDVVDYANSISSACPVVEITRPIYEKIAVRDTDDGILGVALSKLWEWPDLFPSDRAALVVVCEGVEKPGNLGALLRTMDAASATGLVTIGQGSDPYNPNVIRASLGAAFSVPHRHATVEELVEVCHSRKVSILAAALTERAQSLYDTALAGDVAICLGTEAEGISPSLLAVADHIVQIPMTGMVDSLNVSVSGAVILYEAWRQRQS